MHGNMQPVRWDRTVRFGTVLLLIPYYTVSFWKYGVVQQPLIIMPPNKDPEWHRAVLLWDRRGRFTRCQMPDARILRF